MVSPEFRRAALDMKTEQGVLEFRRWCDEVGIKLHPKLCIGLKGSCADIGVVATGNIPAGERLATIPRSSVLTASTSCAAAIIRDDSEIGELLEEGLSTWIPLLLALMAEQTKGSSHWQPYLNLVPASQSSPPPMLWSSEEREQLLQGTGMYDLVEDDLRRSLHDYKNIALPFIRRHQELYGSVDNHTFKLFQNAVAFVMSYSFTDLSNDPLSQTMMVPFVDLFNHHSNHHVELGFHPTHLELVSVRNISKGEEVMNTYGNLPNYSLLQVYGFVQEGNPHDVACITQHMLRKVFLSDHKDADGHHRRWQERRWRQLEKEGLLQGIYEVSTEGIPEQALLMTIQLLLASNKTLPVLKRMLKKGKGTGSKLTLADFCKEEVMLLKRLVEECMQALPTRSRAHCTSSGCAGVVLGNREWWSQMFALGQYRTLSFLLHSLT